MDITQYGGALAGKGMDVTQNEGAPAAKGNDLHSVWRRAGCYGSGPDAVQNSQHKICCANSLRWRSCEHDRLSSPRTASTGGNEKSCYSGAPGTSIGGGSSFATVTRASSSGGNERSCYTGGPGTSIGGGSSFAAAAGGNEKSCYSGEPGNSIGGGSSFAAATGASSTGGNVNGNIWSRGH